MVDARSSSPLLRRIGLDTPTASLRRLDDALANDLPHPAIAESWRRCRAAGLDPAQGAGGPRQVSLEELTHRRVGAAELVEVAQPHLDWLSATYAAVPHVAYLVDRDGIVLYSTGSDADALGVLGRPGADWSERAMGTNGAGTALAAGEPVTVDGADHFLTALGDRLCTAAPVRGPAEAPIGAINFTTAVGVSLGSAERLRMVAHAAYAIGQELRYRGSLRHASGLLDAERRLAEEARGRAAALEALRESEDRFRSAFDCAAIGMAIVDLTGRWLRVNAALCELLGYAEAELVGASFEALTHPDDVEIGRELVRRALAGEFDRFQIEKRFVHRRGHLVQLALSAAIVRDAAGAPLYGITQMQDVTECRRTEEALHAIQSRYERHVANAPGVVYQYVYRPDGTEGFAVVSEGARRLFGLEPAAVLADPTAVFGLIHPDDRASFAATRDHGMATLASWRWEGRVVLAGGEERWLQVASQPERQPDGSIIADGVIMDVTDHRRAAVRLAESEQRYRSLFDHHPDGVISLDLEGRFVSANPACEPISGYHPAELLGQSFVPVLAPEQVEPVLARFQASLRGEPQTYETVIRHKSGRPVEIAITNVPIVVGGTVVGVYGIIKDLTAQHSLEEQLRQAQKMEAIGRLAGGIAHDFNNLLTVILANAELVLGSLADDALRDDVETIRQTAERAAALTRQLLAFSRKQVVQPRVVDLNALVAGTERMLRRTLAESITVALELAPGASCVRADPGQIEQVLLNLAVNAGDAMLQGGTLTIRTGAVIVDDAFALRHRGLRPGDYVTLEVQDTGIGIPREHLGRIFDPFFTTKERGKGTGLGLSTVYGIAKQYGGYTAVDSTPGAGTTFTVFLPRHQGGEEGQPELAARRMPTGSETVLVVEDEAALRKSTRRILTLHGYTVLEARHGADALRIVDEATAPIDLVVTDLVMPEMGGRELIAGLRVRSLVRGIAPRILIVSGYDEQAVLKGEALPEGTNFLEKPFTVDGLLQAVRAALDADDPAGPAPA